MDKYLNQLLEDIENEILERWNEIPPYTYRVGMLNHWQDPPQGFTGPEFGYESKVSDKNDDKFIARSGISFEETIKEIENYIEPNKAIAKLPFIEFTDLDLSQFPKAETLIDEQITMLVMAISRLLTSYNFIVPSTKIASRLIYPLLLDRLSEPCSIPKHGCIGIEFCSFDSDNCSFGSENCECKDKF